MRHLLVKEIWPGPDPAVVEELRQSGLGSRTRSLIFKRTKHAFIRISGGVTLAGCDNDDFCVVEGDGGFNYWPPLPEADPWWRAASMYAAYTAAEEEQLLLPVAYKAMWLGFGGVYGPDGKTWVWPSRFMGPAQCDTISPSHSEPAPVIECECGFHAAFSVSELAAEYRDAGGILVVTPVGRTFWHDNAWRAEGYQVHAAVVPLDWEVPEDWDPEVPVIRARTPLIPYRAYQAAREVRAMIALELEEVGR